MLLCDTVKSKNSNDLKSAMNILLLSAIDFSFHAWVKWVEKMLFTYEIQSLFWHSVHNIRTRKVVKVEIMSSIIMIH